MEAHVGRGRAGSSQALENSQEETAALPSPSAQGAALSPPPPLRLGRNPPAQPTRAAAPEQVGPGRSRGRTPVPASSARFLPRRAEPRAQTLRRGAPGRANGRRSVPGRRQPIRRGGRLPRRPAAREPLPLTLPPRVPRSPPPRGPRQTRPAAAHARRPN